MKTKKYILKYDHVIPLLFLKMGDLKQLQGPDQTCSIVFPLLSISKCGNACGGERGEEFLIPILEHKSRIGRQIDF